MIIYLLNKSFINPSTKIGKNCVLGYRGIAVVIHKRAIIGNNVTIGTCVTIGIGFFIGANFVVTRSFPPKSLVSGIPGKVIKENINIDEYR